MKKVLSFIFALTLIVCIPVTAFAQVYDIADGSISIVSYGDGLSQRVYQPAAEIYNVEDDDPVITGTLVGDRDSFIYPIDLYAHGGELNVTLKDVNIDSHYGLYIFPSDSTINISLEGDNSVSADNAPVTIESTTYDSDGTRVNDSSVTFGGEGSLSATSNTGVGMVISGVDVNIEGVTVDVTGGSMGIGVYDATLAISDSTVSAVSKGTIDYYTPDLDEDGNLVYDENGEVSMKPGNVTDAGIFAIDAEIVIENSDVTAKAGENELSEDEYSGAIVLLGDSTLTVGDGLTVTNGEGEEVETDAESLKAESEINIKKPEPIRVVRFISNAPATADSSDAMVQVLAPRPGMDFTFTELNEDTLKKLSEGVDGELLLSGSYAFADGNDDHGSFRLNFCLGKDYAFKYVVIRTIEDGEVVTYEDYTDKDGVAAIITDHLGDYAVFLK